MKKVPWFRTSLGQEEIQKIADSIANEHVSQGQITEEFEKAFADTLKIPYVVATTSGSVALLMACMVLGIGRGDEVIVPNRTFIATAHAALLLGAKIVLIDTLADSPLMDTSQLRKKITSRTKAIMPVHLNGRVVNMNEVNKIAKEYNLYVIEDAAQALFSKNAEGFLGTQSDIGCFSLGMTKMITSGQGGMIVTKNKDLYEQLKLVRTHGVVDTLKDSYNKFGFNFKYTDIQASIGIEQLKRAEVRKKHLIVIYQKYAEAIRDLDFIKILPVDISRGEIPLWAEVLVPQRDKLRAYLDSCAIETRQFLPSLNLSRYLENIGNFPNSVIFDRQGMYLPCGPAQPIENVSHVIEVLRNYPHG